MQPNAAEHALGLTNALEWIAHVHLMEGATRMMNGQRVCGESFDSAGISSIGMMQP